MWRHETEKEKFHRVHILGDLTLLEELEEWYYKKIVTPIRCFVEAVERVIGWFLIIWKNHDWDAHTSLASIVIYKLQRVAPVLENGHTMSGPKDAKRMRIVIEHLKRYLDIDNYTPQGDIEMMFEDFNGYSRVNFKTTKYDKYLLERSRKLEQWHWNEAWRLIAKYGQGWWD